MRNSNSTSRFFHDNIKIDNAIYENIHFNNSQFSHKNLHFVLCLQCFLFIITSLLFATFSTMLRFTVTYFCASFLAITYDSILGGHNLQIFIWN